VPEADPPKALSYGKRPPARQSPLLGQPSSWATAEGRTFRVPKGATRVFLGFADFKTFASERGPGDYTNNRGELTMTLERA